MFGSSTPEKILAAFALTAALLCTTAIDAAPAPVLIDRIVAVVEDRAIYRSEVVARARPYVLRLEEEKKRDPKSLQAVYREMTERMIDETLISLVARDLKLAVADQDIDRALKLLADRAKVTPEGLLAQAKKEGMSAEEFREELRRQILEGKWVQIKVRGHVPMPVTGSPEENEATYAALIDAERKKQLALVRSFSYVEVRW